MLTEPFLQRPTAQGVQVVWFTEQKGEGHRVVFGSQSVPASSFRLSKAGEDQFSRVGAQTEQGKVYSTATPREVWRHEATLPVKPGEKVSYKVVSVLGGQTVESGSFQAAGLPKPGQPLKIMLTSDHQLKANTAANLEMYVRTLGQPDAVFMAGDLVNVPDRASEWFDNNQGLGFFPTLQGRGASVVTKTGPQGEFKKTYVGAPIIQSAPLFAVIGNHEVMGRARPGSSLDAQFNDPRPVAVAQASYAAQSKLFNPKSEPAVQQQWMKDNSFNTTSYEEILSLPQGPAGETFYTQQLGDVFLIGLYATRIWRSPDLGAGTRGKYREAEQDLNTPDNWGWGEFIFEDIAKGSRQYEWLKGVLASPEFKAAKYKVVMMHQPVHGLGDNSNPTYTHPVQVIDRDAQGKITAVRYEYPREEDVFIRDVEPLLEAAGVNLVYTGHSHVWNRFQTKGGLKYLESSNVGNTYGCYLPDVAARTNGPQVGGTKDPRYTRTPLGATGDPQGLTAIMPSIFSPMKDKNGKDIPCVSSNDLTVFTTLDTAKGTVSSYVFDMREPEKAPQRFDEFKL